MNQTEESEANVRHCLLSGRIMSLSSYKRSNEELVECIINILSNPDLPNWYRTVTTTLQVDGWYVNHKKVYRLEKQNGLLGKAKKKKGRKFVKFRRVTPSKQYAYILTVIDTYLQGCNNGLMFRWL